MTSLRLNQIVTDGDIQPRAKGLDQRHVEELADAVKGGAKLPPVVVYDVGEANLLSEGFHRFAAYTLLKKTHIPCEVRKGTREECKLNALASNQGHGLKRTNADKLRALTEVAVIKPKWTDGKLADFIGVSRDFVHNNRPQLSSDDNSIAAADAGQLSSDDNSTADKREGKDGKLYPAKKPKAKPDKPVTPTEPAAVPEPVGEQPDQVDDDTEQAPTPEIDPSDAFCATVSQLCRDIDMIGQRVVELKESPYGRFVHWQGVRDHIKAGRESLWQARPVYQCPYCKVAGEVQPNCRCCGGLNVCTKQSYKAGVAAVGGGDE